MTTLALRMKREFELLQNDPPHGVGAWPSGDSMTKLSASITGPEESPFAGGTFRLSVEVTSRYPFEAPKIRFLTKIYHPNIDTGGRICLDTLKMPPRGTWVPSMNISTTLQHIRLLMATPNADDGLMPEITSQYKSNKRLFEKTAKEWTVRYASSSSTVSTTSTTGSSNTTSATYKRPPDEICSLDSLRASKHVKNNVNGEQQPTSTLQPNPIDAQLSSNKKISEEESEEEESEEEESEEEESEEEV
jgi:ubiquitin-conjugating enzyme E2 T